MKPRYSHLERVLGRLDDLDSVTLSVVAQRLSRERSLLETVLNTVREGILVINEDGMIEYANASACGLIGLDSKEVGRAVLWRLVPELGRTLGGFFGRSSSAKPMSLTREIEITYPDARLLRLYFAPITGASEVSEPHSRFAVILTDITEQAQTTEERIENARLNSIFELAAGVAHEIGNPLNSINIHLQLLRRAIAGVSDLDVASKLEKSIGICAMEVTRLDGIISHFLQAIRPRQPDLREMQLIETLTEVITLLAEELSNLGIKVELNQSQPLPRILGDPDMLKQVLFNVFKNAMEAMDSGGAIRIHSKTDGDYVFLYIADTGSGISQEDLGRIFQPFFTTKEDGHGLGMMVVHRIMRDHGGQIGIDSQLGVGTVITLQFPQKDRRIRLLEAK